jgi:hypothetical protein
MMVEPIDTPTLSAEPIQSKVNSQPSTPKPVPRKQSQRKTLPVFVHGADDKEDDLSDIFIDEKKLLEKFQKQQKECDKKYIEQSRTYQQTVITPCLAQKFAHSQISAWSKGIQFCKIKRNQGDMKNALLLPTHKETEDVIQHVKKTMALTSDLLVQAYKPPLLASELLAHPEAVNSSFSYKQPRQTIIELKNHFHFGTDRQLMEGFINNNHHQYYPDPLLLYNLEGTLRNHVPVYLDQPPGQVLCDLMGSLVMKRAMHSSCKWSGIGAFHIKIIHVVNHHGYTGPLLFGKSQKKMTPRYKLPSDLFHTPITKNFVVKKGEERDVCIDGSMSWTLKFFHQDDANVFVDVLNQVISLL